jgi:ubiquinone/menaquinone biosynthesis C-methylase UbiE
MPRNTEDHLQVFLNYLKENCGVFYKAVAATADSMPIAFRRIGEPMAKWAHACLGDDFSRILAEGYIHLVLEANQAQRRYEKRGHYQHRTYNEVYEAAYGDKEFMTKYHWGLYVATFAWAHHLKIFSFFEDMFLSRIKLTETAENDSPLLADFGCGLGIWSRLVLVPHNNWHCVGIDISPTSVDEARLMALNTGLDNRSEYILADATTHTLKEPADAVISSFLLEHLEEPTSLLNNLAANLKTGGYAWITAALTAAEIDHITEFRHESELVKMIEDAGFRVVTTLSETPRSAGTKIRFIPRSMAIVAQKRRNDIW